MITLYKYFYEPDSVSPQPNKMGQTTRTLNGTAHTNRMGGSYNTFEIELTGLSKLQLGNILYTVNVLYPDDGSTGLDSIEFIDENGDKYDVIIPLPLEDNLEIGGEKDDYECTITITEVKGG